METKKSLNRIQNVREAAGVSRRELARQVGVSSRQILRYEDGEQAPTLPVAARIADALGCTIDDLAEVLT